MRPVPFKWSFMAKQLDQEFLDFLLKARCNLRGDKQKHFEYFDPDELYASVAAHESIRILITIAASLILEGVDFINAYLNGLIDVTIIMERLIGYGSSHALQLA